MQFVKQTITILDRYHEFQEMEVMVGENSGLGYYRWDQGYTITTINSGYAAANLCNYTTIFNPQMAYDEQVTQRFLENIASLLDWSEPDHQKIAERAQEVNPSIGIRRVLQKAFNDACEQIAREKHDRQVAAIMTKKQQATAQEVQA